MRLSTSIESHPIDQPGRWWSRLGIAGFTFFLFKGLLWLLAPLAFTLWR